MTTPSAAKLGIKEGADVRLLGLDHDTAMSLLGALPANVTFAQKPMADIVVLFAENLAAVHDLVESSFEQTAPKGRFWIAYRKGATRGKREGANESEPLHRDSLQRALAAHGLVGVSLIALNDVWSAMRVRRVEA